MNALRTRIASHTDEDKRNHLMENKIFEWRIWSRAWRLSISNSATSKLALRVSLRIVH